MIEEEMLPHPRYAMTRESSGRDPQPHWYSLSRGTLAGESFVNRIKAEGTHAARKKVAMAGVEQRINPIPSDAGQDYLGRLLWEIILDLIAAEFSRKEASEIVAAALRRQGKKWIRVERAVAIHHACVWLGHEIVLSDPEITRVAIKCVREDNNAAWAPKPEIAAITSLLDANPANAAAFLREAKRLLAKK